MKGNSGNCLASVAVFIFPNAWLERIIKGDLTMLSNVGDTCCMYDLYQADVCKWNVLAST